MPVGLCNAPAVFQRTMDNVLAGLIVICAYVYIDDIIDPIHSQSLKPSLVFLNRSSYGR